MRVVVVGARFAVKGLIKEVTGAEKRKRAAIDVGKNVTGIVSVGFLHGNTEPDRRDLKVLQERYHLKCVTKIPGGNMSRLGVNLDIEDIEQKIKNLEVEAMNLWASVPAVAKMAYPEFAGKARILVQSISALRERVELSK